MATNNTNKNANNTRKNNDIITNITEAKNNSYDVNFLIEMHNFAFFRKEYEFHKREAEKHTFNGVTASAYEASYKVAKRTYNAMISRLTRDYHMKFSEIENFGKDGRIFLHDIYDVNYNLNRLVITNGQLLQLMSSGTAKAIKNEAGILFKENNYEIQTTPIQFGDGCISQLCGNNDLTVTIKAILDSIDIAEKEEN